jgi:GPH family glycoside/pentoside/hexuronide:cation symporter
MSAPAASSPAAPVATKKKSELTGRELAAYGAGIIGYQYPHMGLAQLAMPLFNVGLGLAPALVGGVLMIGRLWDAAVNPLMGAISDNTRSRWGRRRPYLLVGGILTGIIYPLVWLAPRTWPEGALVTYLLVSTLLLYSAFAVYSVPYMALGLELSPDYNDRTRVQVWRTYFNLVPLFSIGWFYWFCQRPVFGDVLTGARWLGLIVGGAIVLTAVMPALFLRERYYQVAASTKKEPLWHSVRSTMGNRPFVILMSVTLLLTLGQSTAETLSFYVLTYHVFGGDTVAVSSFMGVNTLVYVASAFGAIPIVRWAVARLGKRQALNLCLWINLSVDLFKWVLASPTHPWLWMLINPFSQFGNLGFWILINSMKADICDWDELTTGRRREGIFGSVSNLLLKGSAAVTYLLGGLVLQAVGFDAARGGAQSAHSILWMRIFFSLGPVVCLAPAIWLLKHYRLGAGVMERTRTELERRRGKLAD